MHNNPHLLESGRDLVTHNIHCAICGELLEKQGKVLQDHVLSEWHHWGKQLFQGVRDTDERGRTTRTFKVPPRQVLAKISEQTNFFFCLPCFQELFDPKENCISCSSSVDKDDDHSTATFLFRQKNKYNHYINVEMHHECLPYIFSAVKEYVAKNKEGLINEEVPIQDN